MERLFDTINSTEIGRIFIEYATNMSSLEIKILVALTALMVLFLVSRWLGKGAFWALLLIYAIAVILYQANIFNFYETHTRETDTRMEQLEEELKN